MCTEFRAEPLHWRPAGARFDHGSALTVYTDRHTHKHTTVYLACACTSYYVCSITVLSILSGTLYLLENHHSRLIASKIPINESSAMNITSRLTLIQMLGHSSNVYFALILRQGQLLEIFCVILFSLLVSFLPSYPQGDITSMNVVLTVYSLCMLKPGSQYT